MASRVTARNDGGTVYHQDQSKFNHIIASLHKATLDETHWRVASALINDFCGTKGDHLSIIDDGGTVGVPRFLFGRLYFHGEPNEDAEREYTDTYFEIDERMPRLLRLPESRVMRTVEVFTEQELKTSPLYNDLMRRVDCQNSLNIRLQGLDGVHIIWSFADPVDQDGWSSGQIKTIEALLTHIRQFVRVRQALGGARALRASLTALLDNNLVGVIYLDRRGMIVEANGRARAILRRGDGLVDRAGFLRARLAADDVRLGSLLARVLPSAGPAVGGSVTVARSPVLPGFALHVTPVGGHDVGFGIGDVAALVVVVDPAAKRRVDPESVARILALTRAEARVAAALAEGATMREIAEATNRAESTVRELIKRIHFKLGVSRRADLVRMVLSVAGADLTPQ